MLEALRQFTAATKSLPPGGSVIEAAKDYARRHPTNVASKLLPDVVKEFIAAKTQDGASQAYLRTLRFHLKPLQDRFKTDIKNVQASDLDAWLREAKHSGTLTIGGDGTTPAAYTGIISGGTGGALIKTGARTLTLSGGNTYSGGTTVNQGTLLVTNAAGTGPVTVNSGGTLAGNSLIGGSTTISGTHAPGNNGVGIQTFSGGLAYTASGHLQWQLTDNVTTGRGTSFDAINVNSGTFAIATGAALDITVSGAVNFTNTFWDTAHTWTIADLGAGVTGTGCTETFTIGTITGGGYNVSEGYFAVTRIADGSGKNDVILTWTPSAYEVWRIANITNLNGSASIAPTSDPDLDGNNNLAEFAFGSDPLSAAGQTKIFPKTADDLGNRASILTIAVRTGTPAFTGSPSPSATNDGITYTIQGASTIGTWDTSVTPLASPAITGLPTLPSGYEYRSFTLTGSSGQPGTGFLRATVTKP